MARPNQSKVHKRSPPSTFAAPAWLTGLAIVVLVFVAYRPVLDNQFVWQDVATIERDIAPVIHSAASDNRWACPEPPRPPSPLVRGTFWVEHRLWGLNARGYHLVGLVSHAISALLVWRLLVLLALPGAPWAAMIFAVHPVCVASVAWVATTGAVVSQTLCLASLLAFWRSLGDQAGEAGDRVSLVHRNVPLYALAIGLYGLALLSDQTSIALPAVLVIVQWWKHGQVTRRILARVAPFAVLALLAAVARSTVYSSDHAPFLAPGSDSIVSSALVAGRAFWFYTGKLAWPERLMFIYPRWEVDPRLWWHSVPLVAVPGMVAGLWWFRARISRGPCAAVLIFGIVLLAQYSSGSAFGLFDAQVADHLQYQAALAMIAAAATTIVVAIRRLTSNSNALVAVASIVVLVPLVVFAERRTHVFHDRATLDRDTVLHNPDAWMAQHDLAVVLHEQGQLDQALEAEQHAIEVLDQRRLAAPLNDDYADNLAGCCESMAVWLDQAGRGGDASTLRHHALVVREELVRRQPDVIRYRDHLTWGYVDQAYVARGQGRSLDALELFRKAVAQQELVIESSPKRRETQNNLATNYVDIGLLELDQGRAAEATIAFARAREIRERLVDEFPDEPEFRDGLAWCYVDMALVESWLVQPKKALQLLSKAVALREQLVQDFPGVVEYRERLAILYADIGLKERGLENFAAAEQAFRSALEQRERLAQDHPAVDDFQDKLAANHVDIGSIQSANGELTQAETSCRKAIEIRAQLARKHPENAAHAQRLAGSIVELGILQREAGRADESVLSCQQAIEICERLLREAPNTSSYQTSLAWACENLGLAQIAAAHTAAAVVTCQTAVRINEGLVRDSSGEINHREALGRAYENLATAQFAAGQFTEAEANHRQALEVRAQLIQDGPAVDLYKHLTASSCHALADVLRAADRPHGAAELYQAAIDIHESLVGQNPSVTYRSSLRDDRTALADVLAELGDWSRSAAEFAKAAPYGDRAVKIDVARALVQLAAGDEAGYQENCDELVRDFRTNASPDASFQVALALVAGNPGAKNVQAALEIARQSVVASAHPGANILVAAAQYRAGTVGDAASGLAAALAALDSNVVQRERALVLRLLGTMLLADIYREQRAAVALDTQLTNLDELIIESLVSAPALQEDGLPSWSVRWAVEIARRQLSNQRQLPSTESPRP